MNSPFSFDALLIFGFLSLLLLAGVLLRGNLALLQKYLFPSCLVGGFLGMIILNTGLVSLDAREIETFAYHFFNISFISVGLTGSGKKSPGKSDREVFRGSAWMALIQGITFPLQAVTGALVVLLFGLAGRELFPTFGFLAPLGFNEGPGQALSFGKVWEGIGFEGGATIGVTFATIGFMFAFFVGVPFVNRGIRRGLASSVSGKIPAGLAKGLVREGEERESAGTLTTHSANIDSLAFHGALIGLVYLLTYLFVSFLSGLLPADAGKMLWGFFFFFGLLIALVFRRILERFNCGRFLDEGVQRRLTGFSVDYLIAATVAAIQFAVVAKYLLPIVIISLLAGLFTTLSVFQLGRRLGSYNIERTAAIYGTVTGTVSCGLLLLRIADPEFKTPAALEIALMNVFVLPLVGGGTVLVNAPIWWDWSLLLTSAVYGGVILLSLLLMKLLKLIGPPKY